MSENNADTIIADLRSAINEGNTSLSNVPGLIMQVIEADAWRRSNAAHSNSTGCFSTFDEFVGAASPDGLGSDIKTLIKLCGGNLEALDLINSVRETPGRGGDRRSVKFKENNVPFEKIDRGNSICASLQKLRRSRPDLHRKCLAKKLSINQAMIAAGFREETVQIPKDVFRTSRKLKQIFDASEISRLIRLLNMKD